MPGTLLSSTSTVTKSALAERNPMCHHFDTKLAKDSSLNVCDLHLFRSAPDTRVMAMTVNPDVVLSDRSGCELMIQRRMPT